MTEETKRKISETMKKKPKVFGRKPSEETRAKMSASHKGKIKSPEHLKKIADALRGKKLTEERCKRLSEFRKGRKLSIEQKKKFAENRIYRNYKPLTDEVRGKISIAQKKRFETTEVWNKGKAHYAVRGNKNPRWVEDRSQLVKAQKRGDSAYREWRKEVKDRDRWACRINNSDCSGKVVAHHIMGWTKFIELRYDVSNGITLCKTHHPTKRINEEKSITHFTHLLTI